MGLATRVTGPPGVLVTASVRCFVITSEDPTLPTQAIHDDNSILRIFGDGEQTVISCPSGTYLDKQSLVCKFQSTKSIEPGANNATNSGRTSDSKLNPEDCRTFILSGAAGDFIMACPANLLFNEATGNCDWPMAAGCCEYTENNSSRLVQNNI
ncbi:hypothetical protein NQ318_011206 [Aromia moschata]|uniref:Chitin-binding type-2 domain-containing protein n=1 Tax=Aromia moschata TaxID=1265417 RepID=A0AAV8Y182_9CUCU|nr:hypothetical protein NQ318_011206 [Aromia moschata]